ncbi:MAG TPA: hypothetical protein VKA94_14060 [Hyphomicrobiales bacterium]|nr:hypothetical protein [Hyphomicrobiales bacterium]
MEASLTICAKKSIHSRAKDPGASIETIMGGFEALWAYTASKHKFSLSYAHFPCQVVYKKRYGKAVINHLNGMPSDA